MSKRGQQMHPVHPGELLREILEELDISAYALAPTGTSVMSWDRARPLP